MDLGEISQVEGCTFTTEELQQFHTYYKHSWSSAGLSSASVNERIRHFARKVDPTIDTSRLRAWLRTMGIVDSSEQSPDDLLYSRFASYDFAHSPGFSELLAEVYSTDSVSKYELDARMEKAKASYYNEHVEPLDYDEYVKHKEANAPRPVCPYQHLWDKEQEGGGAGSVVGNGKPLANVLVVDLADYIDRPEKNLGEELLTLAAVSRIHDAIRQAAYDQKCYAVAIINSNCSATEADPRPFLPPLETSIAASQRDALRALLRLQIELRQLSQAKPVVMFANGSVDASTVGVLLSTADVVTTDMFSVSLAPLRASAQAFPLAALFDWSTRLADLGTAEYIACHPDLVLRSSEWAALGLGQGFVAHRHMGLALNRILLAASCPPPSTRDALRKAYIAESVYPGPSKIGVWKGEIETYFLPLAQGKITLDVLIDQLRQVDKSWAKGYLAFVKDPQSIEMQVAKLRVAAFAVARPLEYSQVLAMEFGATNAWALDSSAPAEELVACPVDSSLTEIINGSRPNTATASCEAEPSPSAVAAEIPDECPFAQLYRKDPDRFKHIDLSKLPKHRSLDL